VVSRQTAMARALPPQIEAELVALLGDRYTNASAIRAQYANGEAFCGGRPPDAVLYPTTTNEVALIVAACARRSVPMIASGAATSLEGHIAATHGGVAINMARMTRILAVHDEDLECLVEAGVTREQLNLELRSHGLFFPIDPGANATLGGMAATRASGTNAVRYGTMASNVLALTVVQPDGTIVHTGGRARKSAAGYDLTRLYVGSEGTLGVITEIRLKLYGIPESITAATCAFDDLSSAIATVVEIVQMGISVARVELLDDVQIDACNRYSNLALPLKPHLFFEFHGSLASAAEQAEMSSTIAQRHGGKNFEWTSTTEDRNRLWRARHNALFAARALRPGAEIWTTDVCVPLSELEEAITSVRTDIGQNGLIAPIVGHVGDGNFHVLFVLDPDNASERQRAEDVNARMVGRALASGGSCTGEHGIGLVKRKYLSLEHGAEGVATMRTIKRSLDPAGLMNPGKIFFD
jgi:D-lactate dehydrogenase (cytochrome)